MFEKIMIILSVAFILFCIIGALIGLKRDNPKGDAPNILRGK